MTYTDPFGSLIFIQPISVRYRNPRAAAWNLVVAFFVGVHVTFHYSAFGLEIVRAVWAATWIAEATRSPAKLCLSECCCILP